MEDWLMNDFDLNVFSDRLRFLLKQNKMTRKELAKQAHLSKPTINKICSGKIKAEYAYVSEIADILNVNPIWLISGEGSRCRTSKLPHWVYNKNRVPVLSWDQVKKGYQDEASSHSEDRWIIANTKVSKKAFALVVADNTMYPNFREGSIIIVDPGVQVKAPCFVVVSMKASHEILFRQLLVIEDRQELIAFNEGGYHASLLNHYDQVIGCVVEVKQAINYH